MGIQEENGEKMEKKVKIEEKMEEVHIFPSKNKGRAKKGELKR